MQKSLPNQRSTYPKRLSENGNVFFAIFGAIAMIGILGASIMTFMKGPLATSVKLTKINTAENQMTIGAQVAVMAAANQTNNGDCDSDSTVEPVEWRSATTEPVPTNGGLVPLTLGINKKDPWGTEYGYCVWNHGSTLSGGLCHANMLAGLATSGYTAYPVVALISAGPDKTFTTTCRTFAAADANTDGDLLDGGDSPLVSKAAETDDDIIFTYTYEEATGASGGLWSIKSTDPSTATISKKIETTGRATFGGGVLLPDKSLVDCNDIENAGVMAKNGTTGIEICDGAGTWTAISGGSGGGTGLVLSPNVSSGMNVSGAACPGTCYSTQVPFTLTNYLSTTSATLAVSLSNTTNFEIVTEDCNGQTLAAGDSCEIVVRALATTNGSYAGTLNITGNNSPLATLDGTASGFSSCTVGAAAPGGIYVACGIGGYNLITTPAGCPNNGNPTCTGTVDTYTGTVCTGTTYPSTLVGMTNGQQLTANWPAYSNPSLSHYAAQWCDGMTYGGYSDYFLPSYGEYSSYMYPVRSTIGMVTYSGASYSYAVSSLSSTTAIQRASVSSGGLSDGPTSCSSAPSSYIRCLRWDPPKTVTPTADTTPDTVTFTTTIATAASVSTVSNSVTISGLVGNANISISGGVSPKFSKNGAAYTSTATTVTNGDVITLQDNSPAEGQESTITLSVGTSNFSWFIRTKGNNTLRIFTTSATVGQGNLGGVGGADSICTARANAAGIPGSWVAVIAGFNSQLEPRLPWNWTTLQNMAGATVATSVSDFLDGTISAPMNYTETGSVAASSLVWTGITVVAPSAVTGGGSAGESCSSFTSNSNAQNGYNGDTSLTTTSGYLKSTTTRCDYTSNRLLCMETTPTGTDLDPADVSLTPGITFTSGGTATSNTVTVSGVTGSVNVSIVPSAGTANIIKNGVSVGATTTTAGLNHTLQFSLTAPTTIGTQNTATITIGTDTYSWFAGYADSAREAKAFVTSTSSTATSVGGMAGADSICSTLAAASSLGLGSEWKAIISITTTSAANHIPWNWGTLKTVTGSNIVTAGLPDLFDGTISNPLSVDETGAAVVSAPLTVWTGTTGYGGSISSSTSDFCNNWGTGGTNGYNGSLASTSTTWLNNAVASCGGSSSHIYCIEDVDSAGADTTPNTIDIPYAIQVATSSRQSSTATIISGMSSGVTTTLSVAATGGNPTFTVNGGAEVASASVRNGDSIIFKMDAPATGNSSNKMTITSGGSTTLGYWRVWTGDTTGTVTKRIFPYLFATSNMGNQGGVTGFDTICANAASAAGLGTSWKAIISGVNETEWAVNRIGYNWSTLEQTNGVDVVNAGNIWQTATTPLLAAPQRNAANSANISVSTVITNTNSYGKSYTTSSTSTCNNFAINSSAYGAYAGTSGVTSSQWIANNNATSNCGNSGSYYVYCIEQ